MALDPSLAPNNEVMMQAQKYAQEVSELQANMTCKDYLRWMGGGSEIELSRQDRSIGKIVSFAPLECGLSTSASPCNARMYSLFLSVPPLALVDGDMSRRIQEDSQLLI